MRRKEEKKASKGGERRERRGKRKGKEGRETSFEMRSQIALLREGGCENSVER